MEKPRLLTVCIVLMFCAVAVIALPAQTFTTLLSFDGTNGADPYSSLIQGTDGTFYGTTTLGGAYTDGEVFKVTPAGTLTTFGFDFLDGYFPSAGLVQATNGNFYGTTTFGGGNGSGNCYVGCGTVFQMTAAGALSALHFFDFTHDGAFPEAGLVQATDGSFYGTTSAGGASGYGTIFKITPGGTLTTLHSFNGADGGGSQAGLVQATDGNFYGTTSTRGAYGDGTVFKITTSGTLTTLHNFDGTDGSTSYAALVQASDGSFYGTTSAGGAHGDGTIFKITTSGSLTTLHNFDGTDGSSPSAGLVQATDGNFYGTTSYGGIAGKSCPNGCGTIFTMTAHSTVTTLHLFDAAVGFRPVAALLQATNGKFYGTTAVGDSSGNCNFVGPGCGTVFSLDVGLEGAPSITIFTPRIGRLGTSVVITGENLKGATSVTFGGVRARSFTVDSPTRIRATVPAGARTGKIGVTTPAGTATSAGTFTVL